MPSRTASSRLCMRRAVWLLIAAASQKNGKRKEKCLHFLKHLSILLYIDWILFNIFSFLYSFNALEILSIQFWWRRHSCTLIPKALATSQTITSLQKSKAQEVGMDLIHHYGERNRMKQAHWTSLNSKLLYQLRRNTPLRGFCGLCLFGTIDWAWIASQFNVGVQCNFDIAALQLCGLMAVFRVVGPLHLLQG